jgi:hypothetical protein
MSDSTSLQLNTRFYDREAFAKVTAMLAAIARAEDRSEQSVLRAVISSGLRARAAAHA